MSNTALKNQFEGLPANAGGGAGGEVEASRGTTRKNLGDLLSAAGLLVLAVSGCADGKQENKKEELETLRQALNAQISAYVLCVTETIDPIEPIFPSTLISNVTNGDDKFFPGPTEEEWNNDYANMPTTAKRFAWKNYTLELMGGNTGPHYNIYSWSAGEKTKVGQLNVKDIDAFFPEDNLFVGDGKIWQLTEQDGTIVDVEVGPLPIGSEICMKDGRLLTTYESADGKSHLTAVAIDPSNPSNPIQTLKDVIYNSTDLGGWSAGMDYSDGTLVLVAGNGCKIYRNIPEGVDFMDHLDDYLDKTVNPPDPTYQMVTLNGYIFLRLGEKKILIIYPNGTQQTVHKDDLEKGLFKDMVKTDQGVLVMCAPQPYLFKINEDGTVTPQKDPGDHTSEAEECSPLSQEQAEDMFGMGLPDPIEPDPELSTDSDANTPIQPDTVQPETSGPDADVQSDPNLPNPDVKSDDINPGDLPPETEDLSPELPQLDIKPDLGDVSTPPDAHSDTYSNETNPDETNPNPDSTDETPPEATTPEQAPDQEKDSSVPPEQSPDQQSDQIPEKDAPINPEDPDDETSIGTQDSGCSCSTTEPRKPQDLGGKAAAAVIAVFAFLGLKTVGKRRKKEEV